MAACVGVQRRDAVTLRILALTRYGALGSSSRLRMLQYFPALSAANATVQVQALFDDETLSLRYARGHYGWLTIIQCFSQRIAALRKRGQFDLLWIEKEALPWWPLWFEKAMLSNTPYVLDFDDAVFHHYDRHRIAVIRRLYGKRIDGLMANAALVVCGNEYLAQRAQQAGAKWVEQLPTVIDLERYRSTEIRNGPVPRIVWIGSPSTVKYLDQLREPLQALAKKAPFVLRVIGGRFQLDGVQTECLPWTEATEVDDISRGDIGVMPLLNTPWELGKCGYKLIQYMACGLPVVASPVGVNSAIVEHGRNGFLASDAAAWLESLNQLLNSPALRHQLGQAGRVKVAQQYCLQVTAPRLVHWLQNVSRGSSGSSSNGGSDSNVTQAE
jgi:glycosyltransferase involved in cell wall biosynthesis